MDDDLRNASTDGFWWKRFFSTGTGARHDFELGPNWFASVMGTGIVANAAASLPVFADRLHGLALAVWCLAALMLTGIARTLFLNRRVGVANAEIARLAARAGLVSGRSEGALPPNRRSPGQARATGVGAHEPLEEAGQHDEVLFPLGEDLPDGRDGVGRGNQFDEFPVVEGAVPCRATTP